jgi:hypothetical protein
MRFADPAERSGECPAWPTLRPFTAAAARLITADRQHSILGQPNRNVEVEFASLQRGVFWTQSGQRLYCDFSDRVPQRRPATGIWIQHIGGPTKRSANHDV